MGKKRDHQVTRTIKKAFPVEAEKAFKEEHVSSEGEENSVKGSGEVSAEEEFEDGESDMGGIDTEEEDGFDEFSDLSDDSADEIENDASDAGDIPRPVKKAKKVDLDVGSAISQILNQTTTEPSGPILSKRKAIERKIEDAKLEAKARALLKRQRLATKDAARVTVPDISRANCERALKKAATKGVVQLFNAIHQHQVSKEKLAKEKAAAGKKGTEVATQIKQISKTSFLDMLKGGASAQLKKEQ